MFLAGKSVQAITSRNIARFPRLYGCTRSSGEYFIFRGYTMEEHQERAFKGIWIDAEIWLDKDLTIFDKVIFAEIDSLSGEMGCIASNEYLAEFCQCSERKVRDSISKLIKRGMIAMVGFDGRKRTLKSLRVAKFATQEGKKFQQKGRTTSYYRENSLYSRREKEQGFSTFDTEEFMQANIKRGQRLAEERERQKKEGL